MTLDKIDWTIVTIFIVVVAVISITYCFWGFDRVSALEAEEITESEKADTYIEESEAPATMAETEYETPKVTNDEDIIILAKTIWAEARGIDSDSEKAAVAWCILNRVDSEGYGCGVSVEYVATFPGQFAYNPDNPVTDECLKIAEDVYSRWQAEKNGVTDVGRVLPAEYLFFTGDGEHNYFTAQWQGSDVWGWELTSPYET